MGPAKHWDFYYYRKGWGRGILYGYWPPTVYMPHHDSSTAPRRTRPPDAMAASYLYRIRVLQTGQGGEWVLVGQQQVPETSKRPSILTRLSIKRNEQAQL